MARNISVTDAARNFAEYLNRVAYRGESFVLMRGRKPVAQLSPVPTGVKVRDLPDFFASLPRLTPEEAESFAADIERARSELAAIPVRDPWES